MIKKASSQVSSTKSWLWLSHSLPVRHLRLCDLLCAQSGSRKPLHCHCEHRCGDLRPPRWDQAGPGPAESHCWQICQHQWPVRPHGRRHWKPGRTDRLDWKQKRAHKDSVHIPFLTNELHIARKSVQTQTLPRLSIRPCTHLHTAITTIGVNHTSVWVCVRVCVRIINSVLGTSGLMPSEVCFVALYLWHLQRKMWTRILILIQHQRRFLSRFLSPARTMPRHTLRPPAMTSRTSTAEWRAQNLTLPRWSAQRRTSLATPSSCGGVSAILPVGCQRRCCW